MEGNGEYRGVNLGTDGLSGGPSPQSAGYPEYRSKEFLASLLILIPYLSLKSVSLTLKSFILTTQVRRRLHKPIKRQAPDSNIQIKYKNQLKI
jgi:hypothetical protein